MWQDADIHRPQAGSYRELDAIDFHKGRSSETVMLRLRRLFQRADPDERELRILHGILADAMRVAGAPKG